LGDRGIGVVSGVGGGGDGAKASFLIDDCAVAVVDKLFHAKFKSPDVLSVLCKDTKVREGCKELEDAVQVADLKFPEE